MMLYRFGFKTFFRSPIQVILSFLLIFTSLCAISFLVSYEAFDPIKFEKDYFYKTDTPQDTPLRVRAASEKYMNFAYYGDMPFGGYVSFPKTVAQSVKKELDNIGQGYSVNIKSEILQGGYVKNDTEEYSTVKETSLGAVHLDYYIAGEVGSKALYDEAGNIAPYFSSISMDFDKSFTDAYRTFYKDFCYYCGMDEESLAAYGYTLHGRFPQAVNEVAIPWSIYNAFAAFGYRSGFSEEELTEDFLSIESITEKGIEKISSVDDIIGKRIALGDGEGGIIFAEIVGVLEMDYAKENWEIGFFIPYVDGSYVIDPSDIETGNISQDGITAYEPIFSIIVSEEYFNTCLTEEEYCTFITVLKHSEESVRDAYYELGNRWRKGLNLTQAYVQTNYVAYFPGSVYRFSYGEYKIYPLIPCSYFLIPLTVLLTAYLGFALSRRSRKQYALLRSLGASKKKATLSYLLPVACMLLVCAIPAGGIGYHFADNYIRQPYLSSLPEQFGIETPAILSSRSIIALIVFLFAVVALSFVACAVGISLQARKITNVDKKRKKEKTN